MKNPDYACLPVSPTAKTIAAMKEIAAEVPLRKAMQLDIKTHANMDSWIEEVSIGDNTATLVGYMVG